MYKFLNLTLSIYNCNFAHFQQINRSKYALVMMAYLPKSIIEKFLSSFSFLGDVKVTLLSLLYGADLIRVGSTSM